jgi:Na+/H+ antiporter NhaD/arsenite permease-like protein
VANVGGALTPLGDPPLFLGFLSGVPFAWTLSLWEEMLLVAGVVLAVYLMLDTWHWRREHPSVRQAPVVPSEPLRIDGAHNLALLCVVIGAVVLSGLWQGPRVHFLGAEQTAGNLTRDAILVVTLAASWLTTSRTVRQANEYSWAPIKEVAILFAGIFATIIPALLMLRAGEAGALGFVVAAVREPAHFFWASGVLSSFLDNAPTYLAFLSTALGRLHPDLETRAAIARLIAENGAYLAAVSCGSVFMGANTYIGNAPNFMVKAIAEESGVPMPSFFGYVFRYSLPLLIPTFALVTWVFFA